MTSLLTREEMHKRVDSLFNDIEDHYEEEAIAVIGGLTGDMSVTSPTPENTTEYHEVRSTIGYASFVFDGAMEMGNAVRTPLLNNMYGTVIVPQSETTEVVRDAVIDEIEEARQALGAGDPDAYNG